MPEAIIESLEADPFDDSIVDSNLLPSSKNNIWPSPSPPFSPTDTAPQMLPSSAAHVVQRKNSEDSLEALSEALSEPSELSNELLNEVFECDELQEDELSENDIPVIAQSNRPSEKIPRDLSVNKSFEPTTQPTFPAGPATMPSRLEAERFEDRDPDTGRPKKQEEWICFATNVMNKDTNFEIWHPELRARIMNELRTPVSVRTLQPAKHISYTHTTQFSRGHKQPYQESDLWASLFRGLNNMPKAWSSGVNSAHIWAFSDVIQALYEDEPKVTIMENYGKTRDLEHIRYFTVGTSLRPSPLGPLVRSGNIPTSSVSSPAKVTSSASQDSPRSDTVKHDKRKREEIIVSDDESDVEILGENPVLKKLKLHTSSTESATDKTTIKIDETPGTDETGSGDEVSDKKPAGAVKNFSKGKSVAEKADMVCEIDDEPIDSWIIEAVNAAKKNGITRERVDQRNRFFVKLGGIPSEYRDMIFRTTVLGMFQDLGVDPTESLSRQIKAFNTRNIKDDGESPK